MKLTRTILSLGAIAGLAILSIGSMQGAFNWQDQEGVDLPVQPQVAMGVADLIFAQPFVLDESYTHWWRKELPSVKSGYLLVLEVDEAFTVPRNSLESVLYVGEQTAERINWGTGSGHVIAICPAELGSDGKPALDLEEVLIWYGTPELPERVDAARIASELAKAQAQGLTPLAGQRITSALAEGGELVYLPDRTTLERYAAELVLAYSPSEHELASSLLAPLVR